MRCRTIRAIPSTDDASAARRRLTSAETAFLPSLRRSRAGAAKRRRLNLSPAATSAAMKKLNVTRAARSRRSFEWVFANLDRQPRAP
jgi:hypothetical protein